MQGDDLDLGPYRVVVNHEDQYSIWPMAHAIPAGWRDAGRQGTKDECLAHIRELWTDMRPLSVRDAERPTSAAAGVAR